MATVRWLAGLLGIAATCLTVVAARAQSSPVGMIRLSSDGAGPSHILRLARNVTNDGDIVAIIDPLLSAIRMFEVRDASPRAGTLGQRVKGLGACALPVSFRPWRIHALKGSILIESMPETGAAGYQVTPAGLTTHVYEVARDLLSQRGLELARAGAVIDTSAWTPAVGPPCGTFKSSGRPYASAPERAVRGAKNPARTLILTNAARSLAPSDALIVRSVKDAKLRLISARELEPAGTLRYVLTAEAARPEGGLVNITQRILAFSVATRLPVRELRFDLSTIKSKLGQRPMTILSTGEVLVMGKAPGPGNVPMFQLFSCGRLTATQATTSILCDASQDNLAGRSSADLAAVSQPDPPDQNFSADEPRSANSFNSRKIFANANPLATFPFKVDAARLPEACRVIEGCSVSGSTINFVAIRGIRLTRGLFARTGVPYAQADVPGDLDALLTATPGSLSAALAAVRSGAKLQPGNLADDFANDAGVDCSGLVQVAWNGRDSRTRLSTAALADFKSNLVCDTALPAPEYLKPGDAINIHTKQINHVMLFASAMTLDGGSDEWLMLESSSSCDGVCWSVYDPSYFTGWQLRRAKGRSDVPCIRERRKS